MRSSVLLDLSAVPALWGARRNRPNAKPRQGLGMAEKSSKSPLSTQHDSTAISCAQVNHTIQFQLCPFFVSFKAFLEQASCIAVSHYYGLALSSPSSTHIQHYELQ
jgi:hypothetical protein